MQQFIERRPIRVRGIESSTTFFLNTARGCNPSLVPMPMGKDRLGQVWTAVSGQRYRIEFWSGLMLTERPQFQQAGYFSWVTFRNAEERESSGEKQKHHTASFWKLLEAGC